MFFYTSTCENLQHAKNLQHVKKIAICKKFSVATCKNVNMHVGVSNIHVMVATMLTCVFFRTCMFGV
jgi:hypothetical protein